MQTQNSHTAHVPVPEIPLQIELAFVLHISPAEAFDLVANRIPEWFGQVHAVEWDHSRSAGKPGTRSERVCDFDGKALCEVITAWEPGRRYAYRADLERSELKMPMRDHLGVFEVTDHGGGHSLVVWKQHFRPRWFMPAAMLRWQLGSMMRAAVDGLVAKYGGHWR